MFLDFSMNDNLKIQSKEYILFLRILNKVVKLKILYIWLV